ncbi:MAG: TIGR02186 family protein [Hyphomonadaceae bacterium]|nr:TIGR02186 family protein [Hyphomonadaceae bacterium]MCA8886117.1 TIGR02186 family protein [Hyphomonadaceae bacterium]
MRRLLIALSLALLVGAPASAQQQPGSDVADDLPAAVAEEQITVSSTYGGSYITVFGVNPDRRGRGDIVVVLRGPNEPATVMRKRRVPDGNFPFGLWINGDPVQFSEAPAFFAVLSSRPLREIASADSIWRYQLDPAASARLASAVPSGGDPSAYRAALVRLRAEQGLYQWYRRPPREGERGGLTAYPGGLFRAVVRLPANAPIAQYHADTYLFRDGRLISRQRIPITIARIGVERTIHDLATNVSWLYGVVTVMLALLAGWGAAVMFRRP